MSDQTALTTREIIAAVKAGQSLSGANLEGAYLRGANLERMVMPGGETWEKYLAETVPALCTAGGVTLEVVAQACECHDWDNCPMAVAFGVHRVEDVPSLYREQAERFVRLFDAGLIPKPSIVGTEVPAETVAATPEAGVPA